jgi:uncharacterized protein YndB with AHSA1/START domain
MPEIMHLVHIHAPLDRVYSAVTTAEGIRNWWTRDVARGSKVSETGEFGFNGHRFVVKVRVDELTPRVYAGWSMIAGAPGWGGTTVTFDLSTQKGDTVLAFAHRGFQQADAGYAAATTRWGAYLMSLKQYLEMGKGAPNPDDVFAAPSTGVTR